MRHKAMKKYCAQQFARAFACACLLGLLGFLPAAGAQSAPSAEQVQPIDGASRTAKASAPAATVTMSTAARREDSPLVIGPGDELDITIYGAPDLSGHTRVGSDGNISLPLVGNVRLAGLSSDQAQEAISSQLRQRNIVKDPQVSVFVKEYTNSEISVAGEVARPGVFSVLGPHRLLDVLEAAGGLTDKASNTITISHRDTDQLTTIHLSNDPAEVARNNVQLQPGDTVVVPAAGIVYVLGEVNKPGGYALNSSGGVTLLQVLAAAGGPTHLAAVSGTKMVRRTPSGLKEISVPMKELLHAKAADIAMNPGDIVYVPSSKVKSALNASALASSAGTAAIYRIP
ncbi:MAG TPA: polysaccharide biosynthesis/export family protein [Terriglobales bacterium]|nr:polysaccharide biosynthesis/export family protein [Terriglobales bacterium]